MDMRLKVSETKHHLLRADGTIFFYLGDTAWNLFHWLTREEADFYLTTRAQQKFSVIQAVVLAESDGLRTPNAYGDLPLIDFDPTRPNEAYFQHLDWVIRRGTELGLYWGLLPTWGDKWNKRWGVGPEVFTPENATIYGEWLSQRYRDIPLIWILGGDRGFEHERHLQINRAMANGVRKGDNGNHLITFHPWGGTTSAHFVHEEPWLDFNMLQSGHTSDRLDNHQMVARDYALTPVKPTLDAEPPYEDHPDMKFNRNQPAPYFDDLVVRRAAYQAVFAGACGHTYGCHDIWQFYDGQRAPVNRARTQWQDALLLPGASQMQHLRSLMESVPFEQMIPDRSLASALPSGEPIHAMRSEDRKVFLIYFPSAGARSLQLSSLAAEKFSARWFDPRTGQSHQAGTVGSAPPFTEWSPPEKGPDWVLLLQSV